MAPEHNTAHHPFFAPVMPFPPSTPSRRQSRGFSLVEVILALGIMAISIVSILAMIGSTLTNVSDTEEISTATDCIEKMNSIIQNTPFWDPDNPSEGVYQWVIKSTSASPTVFIFYNEIPLTSSTITGLAPIQRVARLNIGYADLDKPNQTYIVNKPNANVPQMPVFDTLDDFVSTVTSGRLYGKVIAMTLSVSPLMNNFPALSQMDGVVIGDETKYYDAPVGDSIFPTPDAAMPADPTGETGNKKIYPEGYLPIFVQAFVVALTNIQPNEDANTLSQAVVADLTEGNRKFTYSTAKLR